jgi:hypothetical protein
MRVLFFTVIFALAAWPGLADPIDNFFTNLPAGWRNGATPIIKLPETASVNQLLPKVFHCWLFEDSISDYKVIAYRDISIPRANLPHAFTDTYTAVLVRTKHGDKIVLLSYRIFIKGWWSRVYDTKVSA